VAGIWPLPPQESAAAPRDFFLKIHAKSDVLMRFGSENIFQRKFSLVAGIVQFLVIKSI